jgi:hypothetical protein
LTHVVPVSVETCHLYPRVSGEIGEPETVNVSTMPAVRVSDAGPVKIGAVAVIQRMTMIPEPPLPARPEVEGFAHAAPPPLPVFAVPLSPLPPTPLKLEPSFREDPPPPPP